MAYDLKIEQENGKSMYCEPVGAAQIQVFLDPRHKWREEEGLGWRCHLKGWFFHGEALFKDHTAAKRIIELLIPEHSCDETGCIINSLSGNFAFIMQGHGRIIAGVDKIRSYPIFYYSGPSGLAVSNSARMLRREMDLTYLDQDAVVEFQMTGYVTGRDTLAASLKQLQAGECLQFETSKLELRCFRYYIFYSPLKMEQPEEKWIEELSHVTNETFDDLIQTLDGRTVWIPLSGGLDSRFILTMLKHMGYDNVITFSYGRPFNWEAKIAKQVAERVGVRWLFVPFARKRIAHIYRTDECQRYLRYADGLSSVPFLIDLYALWHLRSSGNIPRDAVIINGQTGDFISGGHVPQSISAEYSSWWEFIENAIIDKHYSLWSNLKTEQNIQLAAKRLKQLLWFTDESINRQKAADLIECWEWQERQSKFVVNGQRMYDFFDLEWRLPLWSEQYLHFWMKVPWELKVRQRLYKLYLRKLDLYGLFSEKWPPGYSTPRYISLVSKPFFFLSRVIGNDYTSFFNKYMKYLADNGPSYSFLSYREYLKRSVYHRNVVSYRVYETLKHVSTR